MSRVQSCIAAVVLLLSSVAANAARVERVDIVGLDEEMTENVRASLGLYEAIGRDVSGRRMAYLLREAEKQTRRALEPFGYYSPTIDVQRDREGDALAVRVVVDPGQPVRVRNSDIAILGQGSQDRYLERDIARFVPSVGAVFNHPEYEASRNRLSRRLTERGYFDAEFVSRRVEITRADFAADIDLVWNSGDRYNMGPTTFEQTPEQVVNDSLLERLVYWEEGSYYHQGRIDRLRSSLGRLDYFSNIDIEPEVDQANERREVPIKVTLTPAKRSIYTAGVSYGTDSGAGIRLGVERRYVNMRGHKALAQIDYAQNRKTLTLQYRVPAFAWRDGWYTASLQAADEQTDYIDSRRVEFVASRNGQYNEFLNLVASLHVLRERWAYAPEEDPDNPVNGDGDEDFDGALYRYATFAFPSLRAEYIDVDDRLFPTRGIGGSLMLRGGVDGAASDATFAQIHTRVSWFHGMGESNRLILRGELGHTFTDTVVSIPPSLRFYAGGDRSIRGYDWREVGPRIYTRNGDRAFAIGASSVVTASVEFEHYFTRTIGAAVFVDSGDAFDGRSPDWHTGVGIGARYRSPVGPVKFDIARGLDNPDSPFTIGLSIGAEF
ncbi:hypothetical protein CNR27_01850 [Luteimonas chenhongjianii]|uniref:Translocation and assembly module subunit TamA n=1 Tax=Luteimonas chenhongjianii TaxID=2006110 RepID=A0A290XB94_9GAMM|nr:autotransporter assembly complex family protein [Luteimonas chenhongjianii]ATD66343.1 hypothetical protein CNR27_01850 [Luteimonas chenhongjianii]